MRLSEQRTTVAVLRALVGKSTHQFARETGLSLSAIEKLESGRLKLSESMAKKISFETGVSFRWLLAGKTEIPPLLEFTTPEFEAGQEDLDIATGNADAPIFSIDVYNRVRAARLAGESPIPDGHHTRDEQLECFLFRIFCIYCAAQARGEGTMMMFSLDAMEAELAKKFGFTHDQSSLAFASKALKEMEKLKTCLKRIRTKEGDITFSPKSVNFFGLMKLRRRTAKAMSAVSRPRKKRVQAHA
jgi:transcriptional regulator with XRE-family HTH domain